LFSLRRPTPRDDYQGTVECLADVVAEHDDEAGAVCPVGIGTPGARVPERHAMKNCNSTWLNGRPLLDDLVVRLGRAVRIANDANCFALSEALAGAATGAEVVFGVILGTGVGGGLVVRGELVRGANGVAGEWGHTPLPYFRAAGSELEARLTDRACYCGRHNCVESFLSGPALAATHLELWREQVTPEQIARGDEPNHEATLDLYMTMLARALAQIANVVDPDVFVLGGGVSNIRALFEVLPDRMLNYGFALEGRTRIASAEHGDASGVRGAAWLNAPNDD